MQSTRQWSVPVPAAEFQQLLAGLAVDLETQLELLIPRLDQLDRTEQLAFVTDAYPDLATPHISAGADLTTVWYDELPTAATIQLFQAEPAELPSIDQLAASARWAMLKTDPLTALKGSATRSIFAASRDTVMVNAEREGVRWARHASANACGFCRMLATRGAVYRNQQLARKSHDHCHCLAVPDRDGRFVPAPYVAQWERDYAAARRGGATTPGQIANAMDKAPSGRRAGASPRPISGSSPNNPTPAKPS